MSGQRTLKSCSWTALRRTHHSAHNVTSTSTNWSSFSIFARLNSHNFTFGVSSPIRGITTSSSRSDHTDLAMLQSSSTWCHESVAVPQILHADVVILRRARSSPLGKDERASRHANMRILGGTLTAHSFFQVFSSYFVADASDTPLSHDSRLFFVSTTCL